MDTTMDTTMELLSKNFLVCCYFGQSEDLIKAAIDRAYVDMASHTLQYNKFTNDETGINESSRRTTTSVGCSF